MVVSDDNSVPYLLDPLKAALDAVHAVGWALRAGIDVELPAGGYGARSRRSTTGLASGECVVTTFGYHPADRPVTLWVSARSQRPGVRKSREGS